MSSHLRSSRLHGFISTALVLAGSISRADGDRPSIRLSVEQGLSQSAVNCIQQDRRGFLWIGTQDGLNRYDGRQFTVFRVDRTDPASLSDNYVTALFEDREGRLWVGTQTGGLNQYDRETGRFTRYVHDSANPRSIAGDGVVAIDQDSGGELWIGTWGSGLARFQPSSGTFTNYRHDPKDPGSLSNNNVWSVAVDRTGAVWAGTYDGLNRLDPGATRFRRFTHDPSNPGSLTQNNIVRIIEDAAGTLWIGTWGGGLLAYDRRTEIFRAFRHDPADAASLSADKVWSLGEDGDHHLWVGTGTAGLNMFDGTRFVRYLQGAVRDGRLEGSEPIPALAADRSGVIWAGTTGKGLIKLVPPLKAFSRYAASTDDPAALKDGNVWALCEDHTGAVWVGTVGAGLQRLDPATGRFSYFPTSRDRAAGTQPASIYSILEDPARRIWVGTDGSGLFRSDPERKAFEHFPESGPEHESLGTAKVMTLWPDADGSLWIGTIARGLFRLDTVTGALTRFVADPSKPSAIGSNSILSIRRTSDGTLWLGTFGDGLDRYENGTFTHYRVNARDPNSLRDDRILSLHEDATGALWIGTWGGGLNRLSPDRRTFSAITEKEGLANDTVYGIVADARGDLWMSTNRGLCRFSPATGKTRAYGVTDGVQDTEFNEGAYHAGPSGRIYFGGLTGFTSFFPHSIRDNQHVPPVVITAFARFGEVATGRQEFSPMAAVRLPHDQNAFSIEFAALDFIAPEKNRFRYRLDGLDATWSQPGPRQFVSYTNVPPGTYTFRVAASNGDGIWNNEGAALRIVVIPRWWANWWAYVFYGAAAIGALLLLYQRRARAHARERAAHAQELEHERRVSDALRQVDDVRRRSEERFRQFMDNFPGVAFIKDADSRAVFVNKTFEQALGMSRADVVGKRDEENFPQEVAAQFREVDLRVLRQQEPVETIDVIPYPGAPRYFQTTKFPIFDDQGKVAFVGGVAIDITDKKRLEQQLLQSQKLESIGTLASGIAHDFNNLLGIITGYASLLRAGHVDEAGADRCMTAIEQAVQRGARLVRQILTFARKSEASFGPVDLNSLVRELAGMVHETFPRVIDIQLDLDNGLPAINADHAQVQQALLNLAVNARDAMPEGGTLRISTSFVEAGKLRSRVAEAKDEPYVCVTLSDTGVGMDEYARNRAFEPFFTTKGPGSGTGLGLAVVYGVLKVHGGSIELESEPGRGATFRLYWPAAGPAATPAAPEEAVAETRTEGLGTILVVEDEKLLSDLLQEVLSLNGYRVLVASDGEEGVSMYKAHRRDIDLVLMDQGLPKLTGDQALARLKEIDPAVRVVIASGNLAPELRARLVEGGIHGFLQKPYSIEVLLDTVRLGNSTTH